MFPDLEDSLKKMKPLLEQAAMANPSSNSPGFNILPSSIEIGDRIKYKVWKSETNLYHYEWGTVEAVKFGTNANSNWGYVIQGEVLIPAEHVLDVIKKEIMPVFALKEVYDALDKTKLNADVKTIINCLVDGDLENLKVAQFLLNKRIAILSDFKQPGILAQL